MKFSQENVLNEMLILLNQKGLRHEVHTFDSGAVMVDVWAGTEFYVVQLEKESAGLSMITNENPGFDTVPDERFFTNDDFMKRVRMVFTKSLNK